MYFFIIILQYYICIFYHNITVPYMYFFFAGEFWLHFTIELYCVYVCILVFLLCVLQELAVRTRELARAGKTGGGTNRPAEVCAGGGGGRQVWFQIVFCCSLVWFQIVF